MPIFSGEKVLRMFIELFNQCFGENLGKFSPVEFDGCRYGSTLKFFSESSHLVFEFSVQPRHIDSGKGIDFPPYAFTYSFSLRKFKDNKEYVFQALNTFKVLEYTKLCTIVSSLRDSLRETFITSGIDDIPQTLREIFVDTSIIPVLNKKRKEYRKI